jgi:hypothetical protein
MDMRSNESLIDCIPKALVVSTTFVYALPNNVLSRGSLPYNIVLLMLCRWLRR